MEDLEERYFGGNNAHMLHYMIFEHTFQVIWTSVKMMKLVPLVPFALSYDKYLS
jgi:hypothetical protein